MGVNLPAHLVVIKGTRAWRGAGTGYQNIDQASLVQMMGRAGRPGFDTSGTVVIMTDNESKASFQGMVSSGLKTAKSKCVEDKLVETMNTEVSQRVVTSLETAMAWMRGTLMYIQLQRSCGTFDEGLEQAVRSLCQKVFTKLQKIRAVALHGERVYPLAACHVMSHHMVEYNTMAQISSIPFDASQYQLLKSISMMEGLQKPLRRSEKKGLNAAHKDIRHKLEGVPSKVRVKASWEKAFVLLQVHISEMTLDGNDFALRQELRSMTDFASRMLAAIEEYSIKGSKNGNIAVQSLRLRRSLAVKVWCGRNGTLKQIRGVSNALCMQLSKNKVSSFEDVVKASAQQLEHITGRNEPFGTELKAAAARILRSSLKVAAEVEMAEGSSIPSSLICRVERKEVLGLESDERRDCNITYTLLVFTDKEGGCLIFEEGISGPCEFRIMLPPTYGKLFVRLIGSVVGIDGESLLEQHL